MKNKNSLYIVLGIGAGVLAYYFFCKKKGSEKMMDEPLEEQPKESPKKVITTPFTAPKYFTPVATTTPLVVNVTSTTTTPKPAEIIPTPVVTKSTSTLTPTPTPTPTPVVTTSTATVTPVKTESAVLEKPLEPIKTDVAFATKTNTIRTSAFDGVGSLCFEVGECLYDL